MDKKKQTWKIISLIIGLLIVNVYFIMLQISQVQTLINPNKIYLNDTEGLISVSSGYYSGEFIYELSDNESKWVSEVKFNGREVTIIPKEKEADRTYKECVGYDEEKEICLKEKEIIYSVPVSLPVNKLTSEKVIEEKITDVSKQIDSKTRKDTFIYSIPLDVHYLKIGESSITITELQVTTQSNLVNVTAETGQSNFTHLTINSANAPYDSLVGYWNFDGDKENTVSFKSYDWSKNNNDGTAGVTSTVDSTGCVYGNCLQPQNYSNSGILLPAAPFNITGDLSISAWFSPYTQSGRNVIFSRGTVQSVNAYALVLDYTNGYLQFIVSNNTLYKISQMAESNFPLNEWHHAVGTWNGTTVSLYVDGVLAHSIVATFSKLNPANLVTYIGRQGSSNIRGFNGTLDEIMVFNTSLTAEQISAIYNNQSARFYATGTQDVNNQSYMNISTGNNKVNVTTYVQNLLGSSIDLSVGYYDTSWSYTAPQVVSSGIAQAFTISSSSTNLTFNYTFNAGNSTNPFYSPIIQYNISYTTWNALGCGNLNIANNVYNLTNDLTSSTTCFTILADNITVDCKGYTINYSTDINDFGYAFYDLGYDNIIIKNCKITEANEGNLSIRQSSGLYFYNTANNIVTNNTIITLGNYSDDIIFINSQNDNVNNNNLTASGFNAYGYSGTNSSGTIYNNNISIYGVNGDGIVNSPSGYFNISYNNINVYYAVYGGAGIYLLDGITDIYSDINHNNIFVDNGVAGIFLLNNNFVNVINNNITTDKEYVYGIDFDTSSNNNVLNNIVTTLDDYDYGVILSSSLNNVFTNNTIITSGESSMGIYLILNNTNNSFSNMNIKTIGEIGNAIRIYMGSNNFIIKDSILNSSLVPEFHIRNTVTSGIWNFTNVTKADGNPIAINWTSGANGTLNMMWYLDVNVSNSTSLLQNANVTGKDVNNNSIFSELTDVNGQITRKTLIEYTNINNTQIIYYSNYTITTNLSNYNIDSQSVNMSTNKWLNIVLTTISANCWTKTGNVLYMPTGCVYQLNEGNIYGI